MKTYKIITLGASGAGKTVFLASMFEALSIQGDHGFYLEVEDQNKRKLLNSIYTQIITGDTWPKGTKYSEVSEWTFTCRVKTPFGDYPACQFTYFDYAGGRLTDMDEDEDEEFEGMVKQADAILGLLDGQKIHAWMSGSNKLAADSFLKKDLPSILKLMLSCKVPIHFALSKWDLLENEFSLNQVIDRLLKIPKFEHLVRSRNKAGSPIRLIPVSSVGLNFVTPAPDGSMKKTSGANPHPFNMELPIACVLPDKLTVQLKEVIDRIHHEEDNIDKPNIFSFIFNVPGSLIDLFAGIAINEIVEDEEEMLFKYIKKFGLQALVFLAQGMRKSAKEKAEKFRKQRDSSLKAVKDEKTALEHAKNSFLYIQNELYRKYPHSELNLS